METRIILAFTSEVVTVLAFFALFLGMPILIVLLLQGFTVVSFAAFALHVFRVGYQYRKWNEEPRVTPDQITAIVKEGRHKDELEMVEDLRRKGYRIEEPAGHKGD
jgi:hypothetical protein